MSHIVIGTAGHIDHGKSSLVKALTGIDPDRLKEEKARGITIELGFAHAQIGDEIVAFVDVPGHEKFVRTMLAGVGGIDSVMLVVAADESVMPQTREHFDICRLLRVQQGLVVLTKADLVDGETLDLVRLEVRDLVAGSFLEGAPVVSVSSRTGLGLDEIRQVLAMQAAARRRRPDAGSARMGVDRVFSMQGFGTVVTGTLISGRVKLEDELVIVPAGRTVRVRGVQVHGSRQAVAVAGQRTALNLGGIDVAEVPRGHTLASADSLTVTRRIDGLIDLLPSAKPLKHGTRVRFHQGTREALGRVSIAGQASEIAPGTTGAVRLRLEAPAAVTRGDRFILRAYSPQATIAGGQVLDPDPPATAIRTAAAVRRFEGLGWRDSGADRDAALARMIADAGAAGLVVRSLVSRGGVPAPDLASTLNALVERGAAVVAGEHLVNPLLLDRLSGELLGLVEEFHRTQPLAEGIPREEARERVFARAAAPVFDLVLSRLAADGRLVVRDRLASRTHRLELTPDELRARDTIEQAYRRGGLKPPDASTLAAEARVAPAVVERMTTLLVRQKRLQRVDTLLFHVEALTGLKRDMQALKASAPGKGATVDVATFKDRYEVTRKFAIPLLEWLDRERVTKRVGESRIVL
jgi:selenocysteine-specific elongation factor